MNAPLRFAIIGCGTPGQNLGGGDEFHAKYNGVGEWHALALAHLEEARLVAASSRHRENVEAFAGKFHLEGAYTDFRQLLARDDVDVVNICTPTGTHAEGAVAAAEAGKHVILEKPLEVSLERADRIIQACRSNGVKLQVCLPHRLGAGIGEVKQAIDRGELGKPVLANAFCRRYRTEGYFNESSWRGTWSFDGGGALMNQGSHIIDALLYLMGEPQSVFGHAATLGHEGIEVEDVAAAVVRFASGALGVIEATTCAYPDAGDRIELYGQRGTFVGQGLPVKVEMWETMDAQPGHASSLPCMNDSLETCPTDEPQWMGHARVFADMIEAIRQDREPAIDGKEGRRSLELISAIYESAKEGREIHLPLGRD